MHLGVPVFDLENRNCYLETKERLSFCGPFYGYTTAEWIDFRNSDFGWRTLHRGELGAHLVLVKDGAIDLGVYSNVNGAFRGSGYNIDRTGWQLVVAVAQDTDCSANGGVGGATTFYVGTPTTAPARVGTSDRSPGSGRRTKWLGFPRQGPGKLAQSSVWDRALASADVSELWQQTRARYLSPPPSPPPPSPSPPPPSPSPPPPSPSPPPPSPPPPPPSPSPPGTTNGWRAVG